MENKQSILPNEEKQVVSLAIYYFESLSPAMREEIAQIVDCLIDLFERDSSLVSVEVV